MRTEKSGWTAALLILQIAVGAMLAVGGIWALQGGGDFAARAIKGLVSGNAGNILVIVFGVIELLVGVFMILKIVIGDRFGSFGTVLALIAIIVWIIAIVLSDILGANGILNGGAKNFLEWLYTFAQHLIILGAILAVR
ncbi:MAG: hypothetical protein UDP17_00365 [Treponema sp.]|uniref:hypothetical protein n=1 Tax=Treponema sp. TaxID=166 RepID=UPI0025EE225D|nr:hypothetical protein [uncultured Treponema sp.]MEE0351779.1 hypothetical protein [Treponema sp.]